MTSNILKMQVRTFLNKYTLRQDQRERILTSVKEGDIIKIHLMGEIIGLLDTNTLNPIENDF